MTTAYLEVGDDLKLAPNGSIQLATGWDEVRQRIIRRFVTNPISQMSDGTLVPPDYIFDVGYGDGLPRKVGGNYNQATLASIKQIITNGVFQDAAVDSSVPPTIEFIQNTPTAIWVIIGIKLRSGKPGTIAIQISGTGVS